MTNSASPKRIRLAVFDIDGTIFRSSLIIELFEELVRRGTFPLAAQRKVRSSHEAWLNRKGHYNDYVMRLVAVYLQYQRGQRVSRIGSAITHMLDHHRARVYRYTRDLIIRLRKQGYHLVAISNSPDSLVQGFSKRLHFDGAIGRTHEAIGGRYTGWTIIDGTRVPMSTHLDKPKLLQQYLKKHNLRADLEHSIAVGDTEADLSLLSLVGHPIAFNPSRPLARIAKRRGWDIIVERKDVIYRIRDAQIIDRAERQRVHLRLPVSTRKAR